MYLLRKVRVYSPAQYLKVLGQYLRVSSQYSKNVFTWKCNTHGYCRNSCKFWSNFEEAFYKYCDNTLKYYTCRWTHFSSIGLILISIITMINEYCHNTCKYWAGEYTQSFGANLTIFAKIQWSRSTNSSFFRNYTRNLGQWHFSYDCPRYGLPVSCQFVY